MPTVRDAVAQLNELIGTALCNALQHPKTSISGILTVFMTTVPGLIAMGLVHGKLSVYLMSLSGGAKLIWSVFFMRDAGTVSALVPGSDIPQMVPAHEMPDNPADKVVIPKT